MPLKSALNGHVFQMVTRIIWQTWQMLRATLHDSFLISDAITKPVPQQSQGEDAAPEDGNAVSEQATELREAAPRPEDQDKAAAADARARLPPPQLGRIATPCRQLCKVPQPSQDAHTAQEDKSAVSEQATVAPSLQEEQQQRWEHWEEAWREEPASVVPAQPGDGCAPSVRAFFQMARQQDFLAALPTPGRNRCKRLPPPASCQAEEAEDDSQSGHQARKCYKEQQDWPSVSVPSPAKPEKSVEKIDDQPAVLSVHFPSKGCAIVSLRSKDDQERFARQHVAVVDGVLVEVKKHVKRAGGHRSEQSVALFVAWGHRVERRASVSATGLEDYFNSVAAIPTSLKMPSAEQAPFAEEFLRFPLQSSGPGTLIPEVQQDVAEHAQLLTGTFCDRNLVKSLWDAKEQLDEFSRRPPPPMGRSILPRMALSELFPFSGGGGKEHRNRAGDKLEELCAATGLLDGLPPNSAFLDLCGGPGAWSQLLLARKDLALRGFGFTLRSSGDTGKGWQAEQKDQWYADLLERPDWQALWGRDGTGDLLKPGNLEQCAYVCKKAKVLLCVADGGFSDSEIPANLLELYFYRLLQAELLTAARCLQPGGRFVCKMYSTYSAATAALLFLATRLFESATVVKPKTSRVVGPERYLIAFGFRATKESTLIQNALTRAHNAGHGSCLLEQPLLKPIVTAEHLSADKRFASSLKDASDCLCKRQAEALNAMVQRADELEEVAVETSSQARAFAQTAAFKASNKENAQNSGPKESQLAAWSSRRCGLPIGEGHGKPARGPYVFDRVSGPWQ